MNETVSNNEILRSIKEMQGAIGDMQGAIVDMQGTIVGIQGTIVGIQGSVKEIQDTTKEIQTTAGVFRSTFDEAMEKIDGRYISLDKKMMDGFDSLDKKIDFVNEDLSLKIAGHSIMKADREEIISLHKRVSRLEEKFA